MPVDVLGKGKMLFENPTENIAYISGYSVLEVGVTLRRSAGVYETLGKTFAYNICWKGAPYGQEIGGPESEGVEGVTEVSGSGRGNESP